MLNLHLLESYFDQSYVSDYDTLSNALNPFGLIYLDCEHVLDDIEQKCHSNNILISKHISRNFDQKYVFDVEFDVFDNYKIEFSVSGDTFAGFKDNKCSVALNQINKYSGNNLKAGIEELNYLIDEGIKRKVGYTGSSRYKCSLFKIKYLLSFKQLLKDKSIDKAKIETILKKIKCIGTFITSGFIRNTYIIDNLVFSMDMYEDQPIEMKIIFNGESYIFKSYDMADCFRYIYDIYFA